MSSSAADERDAVRRELEAAERALLRCRRLGSTLSRLRALHAGVARERERRAELRGRTPAATPTTPAAA